MAPAKRQGSVFPGTLNPKALNPKLPCGETVIFGGCMKDLMGRSGFQ